MGRPMEGSAAKGGYDVEGDGRGMDSTKAIMMNIFIRQNEEERVLAVHTSCATTLGSTFSYSSSARARASSENRSNGT